MGHIFQVSDMFSITLDRDEATYLSRDDFDNRQLRVQSGFSIDGLRSLRKDIDAFIAGDRELTALDFYLAFERASLLVLLHAFPRRGERNRHGNGLQQTYGDHIRLMMLGFDMLDQSDIGWLMARRWRHPIDVHEADLEESVRRYHALGLSRTERVAIWIASALHDYGKVFRRGYGLDAEDAGPLCDRMVRALAPEGMVDFIHFGIRNHDLVEHTVTGDTPACFIKEPLVGLSGQVRSRALPMLALIQQIGAASLGDGRLTRAKLDIYNACLDGEIIADESVEARLGRLLFGPQPVPDVAAKGRASAVLAGLSAVNREVLSRMLERTLVLGWKPVREAILAEEDFAEARWLPRLVETLILVGRDWDQRSPRSDHVVLARPLELANATRPNGDNPMRLRNEDVLTELLNGTSALILR